MVGRRWRRWTGGGMEAAAAAAERTRREGRTVRGGRSGRRWAVDGDGLYASERDEMDRSCGPLLRSIIFKFGLPISNGPNQLAMYSTRSNPLLLLQ